jgi:hypothetical protein
MERKEQALGQQRVLHAEEVAALGARAANVRKEQSSHAASGAELRLAQRSIREAEAGLKARELALAAQHEQILAEDFQLNERAASIPAVLESAAADVATLQWQLSEQQQLTAEAVADAAAAAATGSETRRPLSGSGPGSVADSNNLPLASPATLNAADAIAGTPVFHFFFREIAGSEIADNGYQRLHPVNFLLLFCVLLCVYLPCRWTYG